MIGTSHEGQNPAYRSTVFLFLLEKFGVIFVKLLENSGNNRLSAKFCLRFDFILLAIKLYSFQFLVVEKNGLSVLSYGFFLHNILHFLFKNDLYSSIPWIG